MRVHSIYLLCIYKYKNMHIYFSEKYVVYILIFFYIWYKLYEYKYRHVNIFKIYTCMCVYLYT